MGDEALGHVVGDADHAGTQPQHVVAGAQLANPRLDRAAVQQRADQDRLRIAGQRLGREDRHAAEGHPVVRRVAVEEGADRHFGQPGHGEQLEGELADAPEQDRLAPLGRPAARPSSSACISAAERRA